MKELDMTVCLVADMPDDIKDVEDYAQDFVDALNGLISKHERNPLLYRPKNMKVCDI